MFPTTVGKKIWGGNEVLSQVLVVVGFPPCNWICLGSQHTTTVLQFAQAEASGLEEEEENLETEKQIKVGWLVDGKERRKL